MNMKKVLKDEIELISVDEIIIDKIEKVINLFKERLEKELKKQRIKAGMFVGGSFAKGTIVKQDEYDIDIFVRFEKKGDIGDILGRIINKICKEAELKCEKVHGSRDYYKIFITKGIVFEIIPVLSIKKPADAENVTDLSYFHVNYVRRKAVRLGNEIRLAKQFCHAQGVYGAESYIQGFSGYAL